MTTQWWCQIIPLYCLIYRGSFKAMPDGSTPLVWRVPCFLFCILFLLILFPLLTHLTLTTIPRLNKNKTTSWTQLCTPKCEELDSKIGLVLLSEATPDGPHRLSVAGCNLFDVKSKGHLLIYVKSCFTVLLFNSSSEYWLCCYECWYSGWYSHYFHIAPTTPHWDLQST